MKALALALWLVSGPSAALPSPDLAALQRLDREVRCRILTFDKAHRHLFSESRQFLSKAKDGFDRAFRTKGETRARIEAVRAHARAIEPRRAALVSTLTALDGSPSLWLAEMHEALTELGDGVPEAYARAARGQVRAMLEIAEELERLRFMLGVWQKQIDRADLRAICAPAPLAKS